MPDDPSAPHDPRKYRWIMSVVTQLIDSDDIALGAAVPSITRLAREHECARGTASHALQELASKGLVIRYPGRGYYRAPSGPKASGNRADTAAAPRPEPER